MMGFIIFIHVVACVLLMIAILMQSGKGGGLTEAFSSAENILGAHTSSVLVKTTAIIAAIFIVTSLSLAFLSTRQDKSLMSNVTLPKKGVQAVPMDLPSDIQAQVTETQKSLDSVDGAAQGVVKSVDQAAQQLEKEVAAPAGAQQ